MCVGDSRIFQVFLRCWQNRLEVVEGYRAKCRLLISSYLSAHPTSAITTGMTLTTSLNYCVPQHPHL